MAVSKALTIRKPAKNKEESLAGLYPELLREWDFSRNTFPPDAPMPGSTVIAHWRCEEGHEYSKQIARRTFGKSGCPYCSSHSRYLRGFNDLGTLHPTLALEWDFERNSLKPEDVKATETRVKRWWLCERGHGWESSVQNRAARGSGCPECSRKASSGELQLLAYVRSLGYEADYATRKVITPYELDVWVPELKIGLEFNGVYWHSDELVRKRSGMSATQYHRMKKELVRESGGRLAFVWQDDWILNNSTTKLAVKAFLCGEKVDSLRVYEKPYSAELLKNIQRAERCGTRY